MSDDSKTILFCADFADYPFMQAAAAQLADRFELYVGGRSGLSDKAGSTLAADCYFDWQKYQRIEDFESDIDPTAVAGPAYEQAYALARRRFRRSLDRVFLVPLPALQEERYFYALVLALEAFVRPRAERMVVSFAHNPHFPWHIVFYHVCRELNVPVVIFKQTQVPDAMLLDSAIECREHGWLAPSRHISADQACADAMQVSPRMLQSIDINIRSENEAYKRLGVLDTLALLKRYFRRRHANSRAHYFRRSWGSLFRLALVRQRERLANLAYLDRYAARALPEGPFVYFALHYQPERTTVPEADLYYDQISAIRMLASVLPEGWHIVVKEHPRQLGDRKPDLRSLHYGRQWLYDALGRIPNAVLLHPFVASSEAVARARLTASCNGSAVFEGLQKGVAGLTFVHTWHSPCASGPCIADHPDLRALVNELVTKSPDQVVSEFRTFLESYACMWFDGANDGATADKSDRHSRQALIDNVALELGYWAAHRDAIPTGPSRSLGYTAP